MGLFIKVRFLENDTYYEYRHKRTLKINKNINK